MVKGANYANPTGQSREPKWLRKSDANEDNLPQGTKHDKHNNGCHLYGQCYDHASAMTTR